MNNRTMIWVHPDFKRKLRRMAADRDCSMVKITEELADTNNDCFDTIKGWKRQKRQKYEFRI